MNRLFPIAPKCHHKLFFSCLLYFVFQITTLFCYSGYQIKLEISFEIPYIC